jgi:ABC-type branched-subunit amino acid transport system substrate-binding protein
MRKRTAIVSGLALLLIGTYLVSVSYAKPLAPPLRIGVMVSDSGPLYFAGPIQRAAAKLAAADLAKTEQSVLLDFEDLGDSDQEFVYATNKLTKFKPDLVIAPIESNTAVKLLKVLGPIPVIAVSALAEKLENSDWLFRLATSQSQEVIALAQYVVDSKANSVAIVFSDDEYGRTTMRYLAMAFALRGLGKVQLIPVSEASLIAKAKPDAMILATMESSIGFFADYEKLVKKPKQLYLVAGNQANYSNFSWAEILDGALAISSETQVPASFRARLAGALNRPGLESSQNPVVSLAYKSYQAISLAADAYLRAKGNGGVRFRTALSSSFVDGEALFSDQGFLNQAKYAIYRYSNRGMYSLVGKYDPKQ